MNNVNNKGKSYLYIGVIFVAGGCVFMIMGIHLLLNPDIAVSCNGELSTSISCKSSAVKTGGILLLIGIGLLFVRYRLLEKRKRK